MIPLDRAAEVVQGRWISRGTGSIRGACIDSRILEADQAFFALPGQRVDGHDFIEDAAGRGASVAIVERDVPPHRLPVLRVASVRKALWDLAAAYREDLRATVVAVMGSNGKTTCVRMLHAVLGEAMRTHASTRSFNNALGLPLTILNAPMDAKALVCELGEGEPGALARYASLARPDVAVVTSVGRAHVGALGGLSVVRLEFEDALATLPAAAEAFVPACEDLHFRERLTRFSSANARHEEGVVHFDLPDGTGWRLPVAGTHNASNASAAIAVARAMGIDDNSIAQGLVSFEPADMRLTTRMIGGARVLVDCYNANPDSMAAALDTLEALARADGHARPRTVAVLGDMLELGEDSAAWHREAVTRAQAVADYSVFIGSSFGAAMEGSDEAWFATVEDARPHVATLMTPGTIVLLKGSRGLALEGLLTGLGESAVA